MVDQATYIKEALRFWDNSKDNSAYRVELLEHWRELAKTNQTYAKVVKEIDYGKRK